ncbi:LysR family transcriptional regulator [Luteibacter aegosomaticola]|uniref:LysR family transcriptional regulator n=1 Tax=Luteibacter aegosomaticola TaxID=2911538 RepID=UPI001FF7F760|nr:LysR family transcriptional regulator [Luteibacter aegosomaticola]UPG90217.1 LysR family transcriptional regulator [Luteibacter aegosomaticola]
MKELRQLDLNLLKALDALLDERHVTRAAGRLGVTQPAMSAMLGRLRETFSDPLFARTGRGIVPTSRALELAVPLKQVLAGAAALLQPAVFEPATATASMTIAATDYALRAVAVPFIAALKAKAPHVRLALIPVDDRQVHGQLERGEVDLALVTPDGLAPDLHARHLFDEHYVCALRAGHPAIRGNRRLTLKRFCELDHALVSYSGGSFRGITDETLDRLGMHREVTVSVKSFIVVPDVLRATDMVAVLPSRLVTDVDGLVVCAPPLEIPGFTKMAVWHERSHHDPAQRWLRSLLFETSQGNTKRRPLKPA